MRNVIVAFLLVFSIAQSVLATDAHLFSVTGTLMVDAELSYYRIFKFHGVYTHPGLSSSSGVDMAFQVVGDHREPTDIKVVRMRYSGYPAPGWKADTAGFETQVASDQPYQRINIMITILDQPTQKTCYVIELPPPSKAIVVHSNQDYDNSPFWPFDTREVSCAYWGAH